MECAEMDTPPVQYDLFKAKEARDEGVERVLSHEYTEWKYNYHTLICAWFETLPLGTTFLGEDMRKAVAKGGLSNPHHPNCWSGMARSHLKDWQEYGRIEVTGYQPAKSVANCAHYYRAYTKVR
jgi:diadenosine tetraphosphatase ApaH/serine/threonine PP2A family protein phosphatase